MFNDQKANKIITSENLIQDERSINYVRCKNIHISQIQFIHL